MKVIVMTSDITMKSVMTIHNTKNDLLKTTRKIFKTNSGCTKTEYAIGSFTSEKPVNRSGIQEIDINCDCIDACIVCREQESTFYIVLLWIKPFSHEVTLKIS